MSWSVALLGGVTLLLLLLLTGVPVFVSFLILNVTGILVLVGPAAFGMFANSIYNTATTGALAAVPLFIVMGELLFRSGAMEVLLDSIDQLVGRIRGRQYVLCIVLSAVIGALSGAAMAVAGLLGRSLFPTMRKRGYNVQLSAGTILAGASLDPIIPPSVLAIIIATLAQVSTSKMLVAGIAPGLLLTGLFVAYVVVRVRLDPSLAPNVESEAGDRKVANVILAILRMIPSSLIFVLVMGLVMFGVATPTEAAAAGVFGALVLAWFYGGLSLQMIYESLASAVKVSCLLLVIMCCAVMFSQLLTLTGAAGRLGETVASLRLPTYLMLLLMLGLPFLLFMVLDQLAMMLVLIPIYQPVLALYGFDEIWFWTLFLIVATVGGLTPPVGYTLFALKSAVPDVPTSVFYRAAWPFVGIILFGMLLMAIFPQIITFLPNLLRAM